MDEKFCLKWNDFQNTVSQSFGALRQEKDFFDVTLVSDDEVQIPAHKLVLASCSTFFKSILKTNEHSHPLLYLSGLNSRSLGYILDYMYQGEVKIVQGHLDSFLDSAQKLKIKGLQAQNSHGEADEVEYGTSEEDGRLKDYTSLQNSKEELFSPGDQFVNSVSVPDKHVTNKIHMDTIEESEIDLKINELLSKENGILTCIICGKSKTSKDISNMRRHVETHIEGLSYPCQMCGKQFKSRNAFNCHKSQNRCKGHIAELIY